MRLFRNNAYQSAEELQTVVERYLRRMSTFAMWTTGTARDPDSRYAELDDPPFWCQWTAARTEVAEAVKLNLVSRGMKLDPHDKPGPVLYVY